MAVHMSEIETGLLTELGSAQERADGSRGDGSQPGELRGSRPLRPKAWNHTKAFPPQHGTHLRRILVRGWNRCQRTKVIRSCASKGGSTGSAVSSAPSARRSMPGWPTTCCATARSTSVRGCASARCRCGWWRTPCWPCPARPGPTANPRRGGGGTRWWSAPTRRIAAPGRPPRGRSWPRASGPPPPGRTGRVPARGTRWPTPSATPRWPSTSAAAARCGRPRLHASCCKRISASRRRPSVRTPSPSMPSRRFSLTAASLRRSSSKKALSQLVPK